MHKVCRQVTQFVWEHSVALLIVAGGVGLLLWWIFSDPIGVAREQALQQTTQSQPAIPVRDTDLAETSEIFSGIGTLRELLPAESPLACEVWRETINVQTEGMVFIEASSVRVSETVQTSGGEESVLNYISTPTEETQWVRLAPGETERLTDATAVTARQGWSMDTEFAYQCDQWQVDRSVFTAPDYLSL